MPRRKNSHPEEAGGPRLSPRGREHPSPTSRPRPDLLNSQLPAFSLTELPFCLGGPAASQSHLHPPAQCRQNLLGNMSCLRKYEPGVGGGRVGLLPASSLNVDLMPEGVGASCTPRMVEVGSSTLWGVAHLWPLVLKASPLVCLSQCLWLRAAGYDHIHVTDGKLRLREKGPAQGHTARELGMVRTPTPPRPQGVQVPRGLGGGREGPVTWAWGCCHCPCRSPSCCCY